MTNLRWCSDGLEFTCWNGEVVRVAFVLDCHDREIIGWTATTAGLSGEMIRDMMVQCVEARFQAPRAPHRVQWLSDNGSIYTALDTICTAERLHLAPITTPAASPQSNGMSEAFVNTLKRDYVSGADRSSAAALLEAISAWIADYNAVAPHSALGFRSPTQYRPEVLAPALAGLTG